MHLEHVWSNTVTVCLLCSSVRNNYFLHPHPRSKKSSLISPTKRKRNWCLFYSFIMSGLFALTSWDSAMCHVTYCQNEISGSFSWVYFLICTHSFYFLLPFSNPAAIKENEIFIFVHHILFLVAVVIYFLFKRNRCDIRDDLISIDRLKCVNLLSCDITQSVDNVWIAGLQC